MCSLTQRFLFLLGVCSYLTIGHPPSVPVPGVCPTICMFVLLGVCSYLTIGYPPPVPVPGACVPYHLYVCFTGGMFLPYHWAFTTVPVPGVCPPICMFVFTGGMFLPYQWVSTTCTRSRCVPYNLYVSTLRPIGWEPKKPLLQPLSPLVSAVIFYYGWGKKKKVPRSLKEWKKFEAKKKKLWWKWKVCCRAPFSAKRLYSFFSPLLYICQKF